MRARLYGLDPYRLKPGDLRRLGETPVEISLSLRPPDFEALFPFPPAERNEKLGEYLHGRLERVRARWPGWQGAPIVPRGDDRLPWNSDSVVAARDIPRILRFPELQGVYVDRIRGLRKRPEPRRLSFYAVRTRVALQVEGQTSGQQTVEDRIVLLRAWSFEDAEKRCQREQRLYEQPFLNGEGERVRWHTEEIVDVYDLGETEIDPKGTEVYSRLSRRRMKPEFEWNPPLGDEGS